MAAEAAEVALVDSPSFGLSSVMEDVFRAFQQEQSNGYVRFGFENDAVITKDVKVPRKVAEYKELKTLAGRQAVTRRCRIYVQQNCPDRDIWKFPEGYQWFSCELK